MAWGPFGGIVFWLAWPRSGSSRGGFLWGLVLLGMLISGRQVEGWSWLMADTKVPMPTCPGRCLEVDDSDASEVYSGKVVGFGSCQGSSPNQQWIVESVNDNASSITIVEPHSQQTLCLQPNVADNSAVVAACTNSSDQYWVVGAQDGRVRTHDSLGDNGQKGPLYLAMLYPKDRMQDSDAKRPWRSCVLARMDDPGLYELPPNMTEVVSVVPRSSYVNSSSFSVQTTGATMNDIVRNGGFELSSYLDDSITDANLWVEMQSSDDIFGLCFWSVPNGTVTLKVYSGAAGGPGSLSVLLHGNSDKGALSQVVPTTPGSFYVLVFEVAAPECSNVSQASVQVSVSPSSLESQSHNISGSGSSQYLVWGTPVFTFLAESDWTTLTFESLTPPEGGCWPVIDNVRVLNIISDVSVPPAAVSVSSPPPTQTGLDTGDLNSSLSQPGHEHGYSGVTLSRGAISGIVLGAAAVAFGVGSLAFLLLILPLSNKLNKRNSSEQMLPKADNQWDSPSSPSSSSSGNNIAPVHELE